MTTWRKSGKTAVITGGASGIGVAAAERFVQDGMNVVIADKDEDALGRALTLLETVAQGRSPVLAEACDVTQLLMVILWSRERRRASRAPCLHRRRQGHSM